MKVVEINTQRTRSGSAFHKAWLESTIAGLVLFFACCAPQVASFSLADLEGAWWGEGESPTAEFAIAGDAIWLDIDAEYHACEIVGGDMLVYDPGPERGVIERKIVSLEGDTLVLESTVGGQTTRATYTRR